MPLQNVPHGLFADRTAQVGQYSHPPIIALRGILLGHARHQGFKLLVD